MRSTGKKKKGKIKMENQMSVKQALQANNQVLKAISIPLELIDTIGAPLKFVMETNQNCIAAIEQAEKQQAMHEAEQTKEEAENDGAGEPDIELCAGEEPVEIG